MKRGLQLAGILIILGVLAVWAALGANRGWTKTSVPVKTMDEVTGIEAITHEKKFVPGVEFVGSGIFFGAMLLVISGFMKRK
jgi:hypothetical protein